MIASWKKYVERVHSTIYRVVVSFSLIPFVFFLCFLPLSSAFSCPTLFCIQYFSVCFIALLQSTYCEADAVDVLRSIAKALANCHLHQVVHLDLKPENVLYVDKEGEKNGEAVKLCDFGISRTLDPEHPAGGKLTEDGKCAPDGRLHGTPGYIAPEMILQLPFDTKCDVWQLGVLAYILISGIPPFEEPPHLEGTQAGMEAMFDYIKAGDFFPFDQYQPIDGESNPWDVCSTDAKDFIKKALTPDCDKRPGMKELLLHPWLVNDETRIAVARSHDIGASRLNLKKYCAKEKFKKNIRKLVIINKMNRAATAFAAPPIKQSAVVEPDPVEAAE